jgi:hypothetical protein
MFVALYVEEFFGSNTLGKFESPTVAYQFMRSNSWLTYDSPLHGIDLYGGLTNVLVKELVIIGH